MWICAAMYSPYLTLQLSNDVDFILPSPVGSCNSFLSPLQPPTPIFHCITPSRLHSTTASNSGDIWGDENSRDALSQFYSLSPTALHPLEPTPVIPVDHENNSDLGGKDAEAPELNLSVAPGNLILNEFVRTMHIYHPFSPSNVIFS